MSLIWKVSVICWILIVSGAFCTCTESEMSRANGIQSSQIPPFESPPSTFEAGKETFEMFKSQAEHNPCWRNAVSKIETSCKDLNDTEQSYLALDFTNCHLEKSGRKTYDCSTPEGMTLQQLKECTKDMDDTAFVTFTTFFAHTSNICFFLLSRAWQERTENTITELSRTSEHVVGQLQESVAKQLLMLKRQNTSLKNQKEIMQNEIHLKESLHNSSEGVKEAFEDMKRSASQQKALFSETFGDIFSVLKGIRELQLTFLGELITWQSRGFFLAGMFVSYFLTSTPQTALARLPLFGGLIALYFVEKMVIWYSMEDSTDVLYARLWVCRYIFIFISALTPVGFFVYHLKYTKIIDRDKLLMKMEEVIKKLDEGSTRPIQAGEKGRKEKRTEEEQQTKETTE